MEIRGVYDVESVKNCYFHRLDADLLPTENHMNWPFSDVLPLISKNLCLS